ALEPPHAHRGLLMGGEVILDLRRQRLHRIVQTDLLGRRIVDAPDPERQRDRTQPCRTQSPPSHQSGPHWIAPLRMLCPCPLNRSLRAGTAEPPARFTVSTLRHIASPQSIKGGCSAERQSPAGAPTPEMAIGLPPAPSTSSA